MKIGCFALVQPFTNLDAQFAAIREMGFDYADLTDSHDGAILGNEFGFTAAASLDAHPERVRSMVTRHNLTLTAVCAHANLLDPTSPDTYGTAQIIKALRLAKLLGVDQVITTEGDPKTDFGHNLSPEQRIFTIVEKLHWPVRWAAELGVQLLLEPHGVVTDDIEATAQVLEQLGHPETVGLNLDTGNLWLGGGDNLEYIERFADRIKHVHWKDLGEETLPNRGKLGDTVNLVDVTQRAVTRADLAEAELLLICHTQFESSEDTRQIVGDWMNSGRPTVIVHCGIGAWPDWQELRKRTGCYWVWPENLVPADAGKQPSGHPFVPCNIEVLDPDRLPTGWTRAWLPVDEVYRDLAEGDPVDLLAVTELHGSRRPIAWQNRQHPHITAWLPGHRPDVWELPVMRDGLGAICDLAVKSAKVTA